MLWDSESDPYGVCHCPDSMAGEFIEKENVRQDLVGSSPLKRHEDDLSLYGNSSPERQGCDMSPRCDYVRRRPLEDHDGNSRDSGYGASCLGENSSSKFFQIARSLGVTPRENANSPKCGGKLSFDSIDPMEAEFLELSDLNTQLDENARLPADFNSLITQSTRCPKETSPEFNLTFRPLLRRSLSEDVTGRTPNSSRVRSCLFKTGGLVELRPFKRPEPPNEEFSPLNNKRTRFLENEENENIVPVSLLERAVSTSHISSYSASEESIKQALHRSSTEPDLIGDFSISFCLPLTPGRHQDLKSITPGTLAAVMRGEFDDSIASYKIIDCRYPYEYDGGHIANSDNFYTKDQISEELLSDDKLPPPNSDPSRRHILVFHCEFSSERGPSLYRFLRNLDRMRNKDVYPALYYPEVYLLEGGYKCFFEQFAEMCEPMSYKPMKHPAHQNDFRHFRSKSKIFNGERARSLCKGGSYKRLGFM